MDLGNISSQKIGKFLLHHMITYIDCYRQEDDMQSFHGPGEAVESVRGR